MTTKDVKPESRSRLVSALAMLDTKDRIKLLLASIAQVLLSFFDLAGVALIGIIVALASSEDSASSAKHVSDLVRFMKFEEL
jgi:hypothetical protein